MCISSVAVLLVVCFDAYYHLRGNGHHGKLTHTMNPLFSWYWFNHIGILVFNSAYMTILKGEWLNYFGCEASFRWLSYGSTNQYATQQWMWRLNGRFDWWFLWFNSCVCQDCITKFIESLRLLLIYAIVCVSNAGQWGSRQ